MELLKHLFAPRDTINYPPCGMFTLTHLFVTLSCFIVLSLAIFFTRKITKEELKKVTKVTAIILTILELIKVAYNFYFGYFLIDNWIPLSFCSLFMFALYMAGYGKGKVEKMGQSFIAGGTVLAGMFFLIIPTTSLMLHPIYHYLCIYSMIYHTTMVYFGIMYFYKNVIEVNLKNSIYFAVFLTFFSILAVILNALFEGNLMFYSFPFNMPIEIINIIYDINPILYTIFIFTGYSLTYFAPFLVRILINCINKKKSRIA